MGFNERITEDARRRRSRRKPLLAAQPNGRCLEDADHLVAVGNERRAKRDADAVLTDDRRGCHSRLPVSAVTANGHAWDGNRPKT